MLVYEFMGNSSLDKWIFGDDPKRVLDWATRKRIAIGIARGLEYLHVGCNQAIVHLDVKPQNILLDANLNPQLADFGLAKLVEIGEPLVCTLLSPFAHHLFVIVFLSGFATCLCSNSGDDNDGARDASLHGSRDPPTGCSVVQDGCV